MLATRAASATAALLVIFHLAAAGVAEARRADRPEPRPHGDALPFDPGDELVVRMRRGAGRHARGRIAAASQDAEGAVVGESPKYRLRKIRVPRHRRAALLRRLERDPDVERVEPNQLLPPSLIPDDPQFPDQWHLPKIGVPAAWDQSLGSGVTIAILDSGVDSDHPDLVGRLLPGFNFWDMNANTDDVFGHGTSVAGAAGATGGNANQVAGPGHSSQILPVRVAGTDGWASVWAISQGIAYAAEQGARVVNISFQGLAGIQSVQDAARDAAEQGVVVIAAAGNCSCFENILETPHLISVGATTPADGIASWSTQGPFVDVSAPGKRILTTVMGGATANKSGTSFAAPVTAGLVALMLAADPSLDHAGVAQILESTAVDLGDPGWDPSFGHGRIDALAAVTAAAGGGSLPACSDGIDNDGDGQVDWGEEFLDCADAQDASEHAACSDGLDNDADGFVDFPADPSCTSPSQWFETDEACGLGFEAALVLLPWWALRRRRARAAA